MDKGGLKCGDLVRVVFPRETDTVGIFMHYEKWCENRRALVFWDGEDISTPVVQILVLQRS